MRIRFVYFNGKDSWVGKGIKAWTWVLAVARLDFKSLKFNFSHVEVWFPREHDTNPFESPTFMTRYGIETNKFGECFSSTTRGNAKGVRFAPASEVLKHPERWMYQEFEVDENQVASLKEFYLNHWVGSKYDYWGILGFVQPFDFQQGNKWYCSEVCVFIAWYLDLTEKRHKRISPRRLAKVLGKPLKELKG